MKKINVVQTVAHQLILFCILFWGMGTTFSCKVHSQNKSKTNPTTNSKGSQVIIPVRVSANNTFRMFVDELNEYWEKHPNMPPTADFMQTYGIEQSEGDYWISCFVRTTNDFSPSQISDKRIRLVRYSKTSYTVQITLRELNYFLHIQGIDRVELSMQVGPKL